ncbi:MAG: hypothetical protein Q9209_004744 [Squamulea sp. 1 TL-2023]
MVIVDDEWPSPDEVEIPIYDWTELTVTAASPLSQTFSYSEGVGGEVRAELLLQWAWKGAAILLYWDLKLYEGTSEDTRDLDGSKKGSCSLNAYDECGFTVLSEEFGAGDYVKARVHIEPGPKCPTQ